MDNVVTTLGNSTGSLPGKGVLERKEDGEIEAPDTIVTSKRVALTYYNNDRTGHLKRVKRYSSLEGLLAGNPPYNTQDLAKAGLSHITNINTLDAKSRLEKCALAFWNLFNQSEYFVKFTIRKTELLPDPEYRDYADILAKHFTEVILDEWEDFIPEINGLIFQLLKFGVSPSFWPDEKDFRWETIDLNKFYVPDQAPINVGKWERVSFETTFTIQYLWNVYEGLKGEDGPWNKKALGDFLIKHANNLNGNAQYGDVLQVQQSLNNGDLNSGVYFTDSVVLVRQLYKEYDGKISSFIFDTDNSCDEFLYNETGQYESFREALIVFTYSPGERTIHGNIGVGQKLYPICQALMQMHCHMFDMVKQASTIVVNSQSGTGREVTPIRMIPGVINDIGSAVLQQNNLGNNLNHVIGTANYFDQLVDKNTVQGGDDPSTPDLDRGSKSAPEIQLQALKEFGVGKNNVAMFYRYLDRMYKNMAGIMWHAKKADPAYEAAELWRQRCIDDGVPDELFSIDKDVKSGKLPDFLKVKAARVAGDGSLVGLVSGLSGVGPVAGGFGSKGQHNYRKDIVRSRLGEDYVERYMSDAQDPDESAGGVSLAQLENGMMSLGHNAQSSRDNQHRSHIASHLAAISSIIQQVQSRKMNAIDADKHLSLLLPHTGEHIEFISEDTLNSGFIEKIKGPWTQIQKFAQLNRVRAQKMQQTELERRAREEEKMSVEMMEQKRKNIVAQNDEARKDMKVTSQVERAKEANQTRAEIMKETVIRKAENERLKVELESGIRKTEVALKGEEALANVSSNQIQSNLAAQVGSTPNPADFE